ncbi:ABC transporter permease [Candidatus Bathyarchaeota archaeon]|nr:ABC transporter permease [Candidatus Bathyarchaeota archaeon]
MKGLGGYLLRRAVDRVLVLIVALTLQFLLIRVMPYYILGIDPSFFFMNPNLTNEQRELIREQFGLNDPIPTQFVKYVLSLFTGNLGFSFYTRRPVVEELLERLPNTVILLGTSTVLTIIFGLAVGLVTAMKRGTKIDTGIVSVSVFLNSIPLFYLGLILLLFLSFYFRVFPTAGTISRPPPKEPLAYIADYMWHMALPLMTQLIINIGGYALFIRSLFITQLGEDYIITARAKGMAEHQIMFTHVLRNILPPIITTIALALPGIVSGAVITETIFSWYGVGRWLFEASLQLDYPVVQAVLFISVVLTIVSLYIADIVIAIVDPRVRLR